MELATENQSRSLDEARQLYLDMMKRALTNFIYEGAEYQGISMKGGIRPLVAKVLRALDLELVRKVTTDSRLEGKVWPISAHTMVGKKRLENIQTCVENVINNKIPGDLIETGVWRGGASIFMRSILKAYGITDRSVYVADSFQGLPKPTDEIDKNDPAGELYKAEQLAVTLEKVRRNFRAYDLLDGQVKFVQ